MILIVSKARDIEIIDQLNDDYPDPGYEIITDQVVVSQVQNERAGAEVDSDSDIEEFKSLVSPSEAYEA